MQAIVRNENINITKSQKAFKSEKFGPLRDRQRGFESIE